MLVILAIQTHGDILPDIKVADIIYRIIGLCSLISISSTIAMALRRSDKGKDKEVGDGKTKKQKAHWRMSNKKLFYPYA